MFRSNSSFTQLLGGLQSSDESEQIFALSKLCEILSLATEDTLANFRLSEFSLQFINCLRCAQNPEIMRIQSFPTRSTVRHVLLLHTFCFVRMVLLGCLCVRLLCRCFFPNWCFSARRALHYQPDRSPSGQFVSSSTAGCDSGTLL